MIEVPYEDLKLLNKKYLSDAISSLGDIIYSDQLVFGDALNTFEKQFTNCMMSNLGKTVARETVGVGSGYDALHLIFKRIKKLCLPEKPVVLMQSNSYAATVLACINAGLQVKYFEADENLQADPIGLSVASEDQNVCAICVTHMFGRFGDIEKISEICSKKNLILVEDCAQSFGAQLYGRHMGTFGTYAAFSFFPTKPLGGIGDGGAVVCSTGEANEIRKMRFYGFSEKNFCTELGVNSRLDTINAFFLEKKLSVIDEIHRYKLELVSIYEELLPKEILPKKQPAGAKYSLHIYPIFVKKRKLLRRELLKNGIETQVHYPIPPYRQPALKKETKNFRSKTTDTAQSKQLSLPISAILKPDDIKKTSDRIIQIGKDQKLFDF